MLGGGGVREHEQGRHCAGGGVIDYSVGGGG